MIEPWTQAEMMRRARNVVALVLTGDDRRITSLSYDDITALVGALYALGIFEIEIEGDNR